ncbi:MAG: alpha/beta hydrolase fold domain-containing protein [Pseudomonadota bacterium]
MTITPLDTKAGTEQAPGLIYAEMPLSGQIVRLATDLYLPKSAARPAPLLVWLGADILSDRSANPAGPRRLAEVLTRHGVALATPSVRVGAARSDLPNGVVERLARIEKDRDLSVDPVLSTFPAMAATEDICAFLAWVEVQGAQFGLSGQVVLAGASTGAGLAFNTAIVAPRLGLSRPAPVGLMSYSGTCAWPSFFAPGAMRAFAMHNPTDRRMSIAPVRVMAQLDPLFELIESIEQAHGSLGLWPQETTQDACGRILARVHRWCAT